MNNQYKETYAPPTMDVVEVKFDGIICVSGDVSATMNGTFEEILI